MKTIDELLKGTKYEGAEHYLDGGSACSMSPNVAMQRVKRDALENAALASLLPAAVKMLSDVKVELDYVAKHLKGGAHFDFYVEEVDRLLSAISEATKAVEGKR